VLTRLHRRGDSGLTENARSVAVRLRPWFRVLLPGVLLAGTGLAFSAAQPAAQSSPDNQSGSSQSSQEIEQAAAKYESSLADPAPGTTSAALAEVRVRLGTAYFLLHRYPDSLRALAPVTGPGSREASQEFATHPGTNNQLLLAQAFLICGLDHLELNEARDAIAPLHRALAFDPKNANARLALGDAFARNNQMEEAEKQYEDQLQITPSLSDGWYKLGMVHLQLASDSTHALTSLSADSILSRQLISESMLAGDQNWDAARDLLQLAKSAPTQPGVHADLGRALFALGYAKSAAAEFQKELSLDPQDPSAMLGLAETALLRGQWQDADSQLDKLAASQPLQFARLAESAPAGPLLQSWNDGQLKMPESVANTPEGNLWKTWLTNSSLMPDMVSSLAHPVVECASISSASEAAPGEWLSEACYRHLLHTLRQRQTLTLAENIRLTETLFRLGEYQESLRHAQRLLQSHPGNEWATYWLSKAHAELAGDCFLKLALLDPSSPRVHQMLAERYVGWGQFSQAVTEYQTAIRLAPALPDLYLGLGDTYMHMLDWTHAVPEYQKTIELAPGSLAAEAELGHAYFKLGEFKLAITQLSQIPDSAPQAAAARLDIANAEDQLGETRQAIADLQPFLAQDKDGELHYRLGVFYRKIGDQDHAKQAMQQFQTLRAAQLAVSHNEIQALEDEKQDTPSALPQNLN
jgi:tetratricopeptide (TPR) repeat protein